MPHTRRTVYLPSRIALCAAGLIGLSCAVAPTVHWRIQIDKENGWSEEALHVLVPGWTLVQQYSATHTLQVGTKSGLECEPAAKRLANTLAAAAPSVKADVRKTATGCEVTLAADEKIEALFTWRMPLRIGPWLANPR